MIRIRKVMGRELPFLVGYSRIQKEMDDLLCEHDDIEMFYHYYRTPKNIIDHFIKRLITYPRFLRKSEEEKTINHIIVQHLSDLALKLNPDRTIIHLLDVWNFLEHSGLRNSSLVNNIRLKGLKSCKHIIAISEFSKNEAIEKLGIEEDRITVIKCGVNRNVFHPVNFIHPIVFANPDTFSILHVGTEGGRKDFITLLHSFMEIKEYIKNAILIRVGKPKYMDGIKNLGLENDIIYVSEISDEDLNILYNSVNLFICPSSYEGYGLPIMEALSAGTPVICSDIPVFKEIYKDCVTYFPVNNHVELSDKILRFWNNVDRIPASKGIFLAMNNTWKKCANQYFNYIKERFT